jgi:hypothetical protein
MKRALEEEAVHYFQGVRQSGGTPNMAVELFSVQDIFSHMLHDRPVAVLRMLATSKAMYGLLVHLGEMFWLLLDALVLGSTRHGPEWPGVTTYAFYVWEYHHGDLRHVLQQAQRDQNRASLVVDYNTWFMGVAEHLHLALDREWRTLHHNRHFDWILAASNNGRDIVTANEDREATAMCAIMETIVISWPNRLVWQQPLHVLEGTDRVKMCRKFTCMSPCALGPFYFLDTRRLHIHHCYVKLVRTLRTQNALDANGALFPTPRYETLHPEKGTRWTDEEYKLHEDKVHIFYLDMRDALEEAARINPGLYVEPARQLLQQFLPDPGELLQLEPYRVALSQLYSDPAVARRALLTELRYLEGRMSAQQVVTAYGQCVGCLNETQLISAERKVFLCDQCHGSES